MPLLRGDVCGGDRRRSRHLACNGQTRLGIRPGLVESRAQSDYRVFMNAPDFDRLEALFAAALHKPTDQRRAFATQASGDPAETGELLALLTAHELRGQLDSITDRLRRPRGPAMLSLDDVLARLGDDLARRYRIERELGRGGTAIVLLAEDLKHERKVALKILHPDLALSIGAARFLREIAIAAKLTHPHILPLHDSGEAGGLLYYVMPYVEGESLRDRLRREERLSVDQSLQIARQVAGALSYAHGRGIVHRDIKPENILLEAGHAVVSDFGIARAMSAAGGDELSETGIILGTPAYMSPEQAVGADDIDGRTDIYSLGCVLFEMLAGTALYRVKRRKTSPRPPDGDSSRSAGDSTRRAPLGSSGARLVESPAERELSPSGGRGEVFRRLTR